MTISPLAGKPAPKEMLIDLGKLEREYHQCQPDLSDPNQLVSFGTSGHRGTPFKGTFTEVHILAITQAICEYRRGHHTDGPLYTADTHAISGPAQRTASRCWPPTASKRLSSPTMASRRRPSFPGHHRLQSGP